ncbi:adenylyltransferase/cytidyltransferase family protein [Endozoicomonas montiporae]|uniref:nicotinate-nucleotide adenylyltransferase n=1 Tax=Endozoicomonas montiporae CL-33 TaxID=570277 RepID=A0A142B6I0_9GAMM|nr:adenylyltransferase/cytidyltransferase family protein [Endozoicomonas montiporae]AMO54356.1 nicotinate-nucleotide adenylyltransferase [Endozoicomonas montiporae CL-33]
MNPIKIGVFGSAFNPPTLGHQDVLRQAADHFDRILLVPSASHAFSKKLLPFAQRVAMLERFLSEAQVPQCELELCLLEEALLNNNPDKPVYTYDLMEALEQQYAQGQSGEDPCGEKQSGEKQSGEKKVTLGFIRGPDNADPDTWSRFYKADEIEQRWPLFTAEERRPVRSSLVRSLTASATSDDNRRKVLDGLLHPSVRDFMLINKLYQV